MLIRMDNILFANPTFQNTLGYAEEELLSKSFYDLIETTYLENNIFDFKVFDG